MSYFTRNPVHSRAAVALAQLALIAALGGCGLVPKQPITQQPMTAMPPMPPQAQAPGSIYNPGYAGRPLFEDQRPRNVGDILTIVIQENVNATKSSGANVNRNGTTSFDVPTAGFLGGLFGKANLSANGANKFTAAGGANASNTFNGTITVTVTGVLPNGNLMVSGEKQMLINQGNEFVRFSGIVNPNTISNLNAVYSTQVADAKIEYSAKGYVDEAQNLGWLQRFFLNVSPW
ncbi:flagellar basal body L-ring protein FlgH [bacterium M00.F.Ca.ET.228.01.1.1]|uniref:flagellar basal body L-ring protein FlgH n=1 Tax=Paraburkholderia phenoliruptrix TaxID=252970 RepID=UPI001091C1F2|nr:flagellar basal body L-ring protein FlgH [Paraburkholderia phenoliruptrix]MBW9131010.1 flagellar basal body L-ring protein FlgH [Paraburkholderia ginsengiterrae]TGP45098.1 flagellar basal body L-ring protein FlgH [bacterium M00.F.Ca.ET.228.01.1.1]TGS02981.1 flagellar basal body L-ring protein FlgH [bacterium M00.F.Ca.ET.191.01.1.1]TGU06363.1 flagellar basal body L-ring protein FlgH [bacterium M00.F.Ca.ET.155.01.1.1]MBW0448846.1 flagellar basal body L-ring protein FlgH [Paraburkholderia phen